jgi:hypothetical protein
MDRLGPGLVAAATDTVFFVGDHRVAISPLLARETSSSLIFISVISFFIYLVRLFRHFGIQHLPLLVEVARIRRASVRAIQPVVKARRALETRGQ